MPVKSVPELAASSPTHVSETPCWVAPLLPLLFFTLHCSSRLSLFVIFCISLSHFFPLFTFISLFHPPSPGGSSLLHCDLLWLCLLLKYAVCFSGGCSLQFEMVMWEILQGWTLYLTAPRWPGGTKGALDLQWAARDKLFLLRSVWKHL